MRRDRSFIYTTSILEAGSDFEACYALIQNTFPAEVVVDKAEYVYLLTQRRPPDYPHHFIMQARWCKPGREARQVIGVVAGSYMALNASQSFAMIEYLAISPEHHHEGHGTILLQGFENHIRDFAQRRGETLDWVVGEVEDELLPFKFHLGYGLPEGLCYRQPPIEFDAQGQPCYDSVIKHLVVKPMNDQPMTIEAAVLCEIIRTIYQWRYVPVVGDETARTHAADFIDREVYSQVAESISETRIVLQQIQPE